MKKYSCLILAVLTVLVMIPFAAIGVSAAEGTPKSDNVIFWAYAGSDDNDGKTFDTAVKSFTKATTLLGTSGVIVVCGNVSSAANGTMNTTGKVTFTSFYDGVDYRDNARFYIADNDKSLTTALFFNSDVEFDYINFYQRKKGAAQMFIMNYNDLTVTENVTMNKIDDGANTNSPLIITGRNRPAEDITFADTQNITINGAEWIYLRPGDRRTTAAEKHTTVSGTINVTIGGNASFTAKGTANNSYLTVATAMALFTPTSTVNFTVNSGTIAGTLYAYGYNAFEDVPAQSAGTINITVNGGSIGAIAGVQDGSTVNATGTLNVVINGGTVNGKIDGSTGGKSTYSAAAGITYTPENFTSTGSAVAPVVTTAAPAVTTAAPATTTAAPATTTAAPATTTAAPVVTTAAPAATTAAPDSANAPQTGDSAMIILAASAVAAIALCFILISKKRQYN